jgi:hypothetical protein
MSTPTPVAEQLKAGLGSTHTHKHHLFIQKNADLIHALSFARLTASHRPFIASHTRP